MNFSLRSYDLIGFDLHGTLWLPENEKDQVSNASPLTSITDPPRGFLFPYVYELCQHLVSFSDLCLISQCSRRIIHDFIQASRLERYFAMVYGYEDIDGIGKGEGVREIQKILGKKNPIYIGDTEKDYASCLEKNIPFIRVMHDVAAVEENKPYKVIYSFLELIL